MRCLFSTYCCCFCFVVCVVLICVSVVFNSFFSFIRGKGVGVDSAKVSFKIASSVFEIKY